MKVLGLTRGSCSVRQEAAAQSATQLVHILRWIDGFYFEEFLLSTQH